MEADVRDGLPTLRALMLEGGNHGGDIEIKDDDFRHSLERDPMTSDEVEDAVAAYGMEVLITSVHISIFSRAFLTHLRFTVDHQ